MQCAAVKKNLIRVVVDEEIDFCIASSVTGSGNVDKHLGVERDAVAEFIAKSGAVDDLQLTSVNPDSDSQKNKDVNIRRSEVVRRFDSVTPSSESHTELYECRNLTSLNDRYDILLFERRLRKAERISDVQNSLLQIAVEEEIMVSRSLSRKRKKNDTLETRQKKKNVDVAGNIQDVRISPRKRKGSEKELIHSFNENLTKLGSEMIFKKKAVKKLEARVEPIKRSARPQSESLDQEKEACERTVINDSKTICKERGRKMERRCQITKKDTRSNKMTLSSTVIPKLTENNISKQCKSSCSTSEKLSESETRTKMFESMAYTIVELEDIAPVLHSHSSSETNRSVSVTRLFDGLQDTVEKQTLTIRKSRSLSRARDPADNENYFPLKEQSTKSTNTQNKSEQSGTQQLPFCKSKWKQRNKTVQLLDSTEAKRSRLRNDVDIITSDSKAKYQYESTNTAQNESSPVSGSLSEEEFSASDDEDIKPPTFLCRCCDAEFSSRFDLHEHLVDFHRISKCTAVLPLSPSETDTSSLDSSLQHESAVDERISIKRKRKKSVSFSVKQTNMNAQLTDVVSPDNPVTEEVSSSNRYGQSGKRIEERMAKDFNLKEVSVSVKRCEFNPKIQSGNTLNTNRNRNDKFLHSVLDTPKRDKIEKPDNLFGRTTVEICPYDDDPCTSGESLYMADSLSPVMKEKIQNAEICSIHTVEIYESPETEILTDKEMTDDEENDSLPKSKIDCLTTETPSERDESVTLHTGEKSTGNSSRTADTGNKLLENTMKTNSYHEETVDNVGSPVPPRRTRSRSRSRNYSDSLETNKCQNIQSHYSDKDKADNLVPHTRIGKANRKTDEENKLLEKSKRTKLFQVESIDKADSSVPARRTRSRSRSRHLSGSLETNNWKNFQSDCKDENKVDSSVIIKRTSLRSRSSRSRHSSGDKDSSATNNSQTFQSKLKDQEVISGSLSGNLIDESNVTEPKYNYPIEASPKSRSPNSKQFTKDPEICLKDFKPGKEFIAELFSPENGSLNVGTISNKIEPDLDTMSEMGKGKDAIQLSSTRESSSILRNFVSSSEEVVQVEGMEGVLLSEHESTNSEPQHSEKPAIVCNNLDTGSEKRDTSVSVSDSLEDKLPVKKTVESDGNKNILPEDHLLIENLHRSVEYEGSMFGKQACSVSPSLVSSPNLHSQISPNGLKPGEVDIENGSCKASIQGTVIEESVENKKIKGRKADRSKTNLTNKMLPNCISMLHNRHNLTKNCKIGKDINDNDQIRITSVSEDKTDFEKSTDDCAVDIAVSPHIDESKNQETEKIITNLRASEDETRSIADHNNISISAKVTVSKQITAESTDAVEDELLKQFLEVEGFSQNKMCNVELLDSEIDSNILNDELANGYNEGLSLMKMLLYLGKLDVSKYKNSLSDDRSKCDKCNIGGNLSETEVHRYNSERLKNSSKTNIGQESDSFVSLSSESTSKEKCGNAFIQEGNFVQNELESNNLSSSDSVKEQKRFNFLKRRRKLTDTNCPKKSKVNSETPKDYTERTADITNLEFESDGDCVEINPNLANVDTPSVVCEPKETQTCDSICSKSNNPTNSVSYTSEMKSKSNKTNSLHETSVKENIDTNSQYTCSQEEAKTNKSIRIRFKRKRKRSHCDDEGSANLLEIPDTEVGRVPTIPAAKSLPDNNVNKGEVVSKKEDHSGKKNNAPLAKHRKIEKEHVLKKQDRIANKSVKDKANRANSAVLENFSTTFNRLMPVLKLKRIPFVKKLEIDGLRLKFKGTKSKPFWKIKHNQTNLMHEKATGKIPNEKGKANECSTDKRMDKVCKSDNNVQSKEANKTVHDLKYDDEILTEIRHSIVSVDNKSNVPVIDTVTSVSKNTSGLKQKDKNSDRLQQVTDTTYTTDKSDVIANQDNKKRKEGGVSKHKKKSKVLKDDDTSTCHLSHGNKLIVKIQTKKAKSKKETPLTEFDRALLNSGKLRKEKLKQTKKASSFSRQKSSDSNESQPETNREVLFGKSNKNKNVREDGVPLLIKSKIAQKIVNNDQKEKQCKEQEIPEFPPVTDFESMHLPPLLSSSSITDSSVKKYPSKPPSTSPKQSNKTLRPLSHLKKSLESLGNIKDLIKNDPKSVKLKDILSDSLPEFKNPFEASSCRMLNGSGPGSGDSFSTVNGELIFDGVKSPKSSEFFQTKYHNSVFSENYSVQKDRSTIMRGNEEKSSPACSTPSQVPVNVHSRLKSPDLLTDSAFSSPRSFESSFLSPKSGTCVLNKLYEKPKLLSSTPADTNTSSRKSFHTNLSQVKEGFRAEKLFPFDAIDGHFPDLSGVEAEDGNDTHLNGIELNETAEHDRTRNEVSNADRNSGSLEIYSAEASGINISSPSMKLSETQTKETIAWLKNKQAEEEASEKPNNTEEKVLEKPPSKNVKDIRLETDQQTGERRYKPKLKRLDVKPADHVVAEPSVLDIDKFVAEKYVEVNRKSSERQNSELLSGEIDKDISYNEEKEMNDNVTNARTEESVASDHVDKTNSDTGSLLADFQATLYETDTIEDNASGLASDLLTSCTDQYLTADDTGFETDFHQIAKQAVDDVFSNVSSQNSNTNDNYIPGDGDITFLADSISQENGIAEIQKLQTSNLQHNSQKLQHVDDLTSSRSQGMIENCDKSRLTAVVNTSNTEGFEHPDDEKQVNSDIGSVENSVLADNSTVDGEDNDTETVETESQSDTLLDDGDTEDLSDESCNVSVDLADDDDDDVEERIDVLSLYASDDASFLDEDEDDGIVKMGVTDVKKSDSLQLKSNSDASSGSSSEAKLKDIGEVDMDIETPSSPSHGANMLIEVNTVTPQQRQLMKDMIPSGYCFYFHSSGKCNSGAKCRFNHNQPTQETMLKHCKNKMEQLSRTGELDRALAVFEKVTATDCVPLQLVLYMFSECRQAGNINCYILVKYMFENGFLTADIINEFIYMCGSNASNCVPVLWEVFQRMVNLNIQPANDAMFILLRALSDYEAWEWLWEVMLYCNETENFNMPVFCQDRALRAMLQQPGRYFNYAVQWLMSSSVDRLQKLDKQLLQELYQLCSKAGETNLPQALRQILMTDRHTPRPRTPATPYSNDGEAEEQCEEDDETVRGWINSFHGLQYSKNWDYLGELYVKRSTIHCPIPITYINKIVEILKNNDCIEEVFADFLACAFKRYETESRENENVRLDMKGLAVIGNSLMKLSAETQKWQAGYQILCHMVSYNIDYLKYCGRYRHIASVAMEICLQCCQPDSALQILKETSEDNYGFSFVRSLFPRLFQQLMVELKFQDCYYVLSVAFKAAYGSNGHHQQDNNNTSVKDCTCKLIVECLHQGDVHTAVKTFQLCLDYNFPFVLDILMTRSLLVACLEMRYGDVAQNLYDMLLSTKVYPLQRIEKRQIIIPLWMSCQEMHLVIKEYLNWLYNVLCDALLENRRPTQADLQLCVRLAGPPITNRQQVPFLSGIPMSVVGAQKMVLDVLTSRMVPGMNAIIQLDGMIKLEPATLERWLCETDKKNRRQGLVFQQPLMPRPGMNNMHRSRGGYHRLSRPRIPR